MTGLTAPSGPAPQQGLQEVKPKPQSPEDKAEDRLLQLVEEGGVYARLVEAAESAAAIASSRRSRASLTLDGCAESGSPSYAAVAASTSFCARA